MSKESLEVKPMDFPDFSREKGPSAYRVIKAKAGALSKFDPDFHTGGKQADTRFELDDGARKALALEEVERKMLQKRIDTEVERIKATALTAGKDQGYTDGLKAGAAKAYGEFKADGEQKLARVEQVFAEIEGMKAAAFAANERFMLEIAFQIAKAVCLKELATDPEYVKRLVGTLIDQAGVREQMRIRIAPRDAGALEAVREGVLGSFSQLQNFKVEVDESLRSGVVLETDWTRIEASLETQLKRFQDALLAGTDPGASGTPEEGSWSKTS